MIWICIMIIAFMATVAYSVDVAYMHLIKSELRCASDAAAKATAEALARDQDIGQAIARGQQVARLNAVAGKGLELRSSDFQFGKSVQAGSGKFLFTLNGSPANSVRVTGKRTDDSISGGIPLFFGKLFSTSRFQPIEQSTATYLERDIVLVVDRSGSMLDDAKLINLKAAILLFNSILAASPVEERVGVASYSTDATIDIGLTEDLSLVNNVINGLVASGFTNISDGMDAGADIMAQGASRQFIERTMIVLTDGIQNKGRPARDAAADIAASGATIHTITFGSDADKGAMRRVAQIGKGKSFHADNGTQLRAVFEEIALTLSTILTE